jgi:heme-degrading monooxygenase HmoA
MSGYELAQLNIALMRAPLESPDMAGFVANLDRINTLADGSPGFVWRLQTDQGDATAMRPMGDDMLVNVSVWRDLDALAQFVYKSAHAEILRRRKEWFERMQEAFVVLWWVPGGHRPDIAEARSRLDLLRAMGPIADAFTFRHLFAAPDAS